VSQKLRHAPLDCAKQARMAQLAISLIASVFFKFPTKQAFYALPRLWHWHSLEDSSSELTI